MFSDSSSSEDQTPNTPFNAIQAAATAISSKRASQTAKKRMRPQKADDELYKAIQDSLAQPRETRGIVDAGVKVERRSRYIQRLVDSAKVRRDESERVAERRMVREREKEDALYAGKERFVTTKYKERLEESERRRKDEKEEERVRGNVSDFYKGLLKGRNAAMGGREDARAEGERDVRDGGDARSAGRDPSQELRSADRAPRDVHSHVEDAARGAEAQMKSDGGPVATRARGKRKRGKRGARRNDAAAIEAYRRRYFERRARRIGVEMHST